MSFLTDSFGGCLPVIAPGQCFNGAELGSLEKQMHWPTRRGFLQAACIAPTILGGLSAFSQDVGEQVHPQGFWNQPRTIWMKRPATGEEIKATYWADGQLIQAEYQRICWFMRDVRMQQRIRQLQASGQAVPASLYCAVFMSPVLLDILYATNGWLEFHNMARALLLNSGFRHHITNSETEGAAKDGKHVQGAAGDIAIPGVRASAVSSYGLWLRGGGVGWYPDKAFTHVDSGNVRFWKG